MINCPNQNKSNTPLPFFQIWPLHPYKNADNTPSIAPAYSANTVLKVSTIHYAMLKSSKTAHYIEIGVCQICNKARRESQD